MTLMVVTFWVLMSFLTQSITGTPVQIDEFKFYTQSGCELAKMRMGPAVQALDIRCVSGREEQVSR